MRKLLFVLLLIPFCTTITVGCGDSKPKVVEPGPVDTAAEEAQSEADTETAE